MSKHIHISLILVAFVSRMPLVLKWRVGLETFKFGLEKMGEYSCIVAGHFHILASYRVR